SPRAFPNSPLSSLRPPSPPLSRSPSVSSTDSIRYDGIRLLPRGVRPLPRHPDSHRQLGRQHGAPQARLRERRRAQSPRVAPAPVVRPAAAAPAQGTPAPAAAPPRAAPAIPSATDGRRGVLRRAPPAAGAPAPDVHAAPKPGVRVVGRVRRGPGPDAARQPRDGHGVRAAAAPRVRGADGRTVPAHAAVPVQAAVAAPPAPQLARAFALAFALVDDVALARVLRRVAAACVACVPVWACSGRGVSAADEPWILCHAAAVWTSSDADGSSKGVFPGCCWYL
ncbi:hypothetical protein BJ912DRAFT_1037456, partial [Pholiota molesta]